MDKSSEVDIWRSISGLSVSLCHLSRRCSQGKKAVYNPVTDPEALLMPKPAEATCSQQEALTPEQLASVFVRSLQQPDTSWPDNVEEVVADCKAAAARARPDPAHHAARHHASQAGSQIGQTACRGPAGGSTARLPDSSHPGRPPTATELMAGLSSSHSPEQRHQQHHGGGRATFAADCPSANPTLGLQDPPSALGVFAGCDSSGSDDDLDLLQAAMEAEQAVHGFIDIPYAPIIDVTHADQHEEGHHLQDYGKWSQEARQHAAPWDRPLPSNMQGHISQMDQQPQHSDIIFDCGNEASAPTEVQGTFRKETREFPETSLQKAVGPAVQAEADRSNECAQDIPMVEPSGDEDIVFPDEQPGEANQISFLGEHHKHNSGLLQHNSVAHGNHRASDPAAWMETLYFEDMPEEGYEPHFGEARHASLHGSLQQEKVDRDAGTAFEAAQHLRSDSLTEQGVQPQTATDAAGQHVMADEVLQMEGAPEHAHNDDIIFDDSTADYSAHWLQAGSPDQTAGDSNACQEMRQSDIASGSAMGRQKRIREELRDKVIQVNISQSQRAGHSVTHEHHLPLWTLKGASANYGNPLLAMCKDALQRCACTSACNTLVIPGAIHTSQGT